MATNPLAALASFANSRRHLISALHATFESGELLHAALKLMKVKVFKSGVITLIHKPKSKEVKKII